MRTFHINENNGNAAALIRYLESLDFVSEKPETIWYVDDLDNEEKAMLESALKEAISEESTFLPVNETLNRIRKKYE